jgi:hypothetical protein
MMNEIESFIERHGLEWHATSLAKTMRSSHLTMQDVWDRIDPDSLVYIATCPNVLSQEELIRFGVWAIRQIPGWECEDKDKALALIEKHAASDLTPEADEDRTTANRIAGMLGEDAVPCTSPGGASFARLALQYLAKAACVDRSREYTIPPAGAVRDSLSCTRGALGLGEIPKHFAAWLRTYTTPDLFVTFQPHSSLVSGWRIKAPPGKVQALQTQSRTAPPPPKDGAAVGETLTVSPRPPMQPPVRLCCGERHAGIVCPDGEVMCSLRFEKVAVEELTKSLEQLAFAFVHFTNAAQEAGKALTEATKVLLEKATTRQECEVLCVRLPHGSHAWALAHDKGFRLALEDSAKQYAVEGKAQP